MPRIHEASVIQQSITWETVRPEVLDLLMGLTDSKTDTSHVNRVAIMRAPAAEFENLILEDFRPAGVAVPKVKPLGAWADNVFVTCTVQHFPSGCLAAVNGQSREVYNAEETKFLEQVRWRVSFPLSVDEDETRVAILVSLDEQRPNWLDHDSISLAWVASQLIASRAANVKEISFENAITHVLANEFCKSREEQLSLLLRVLCSGRGLGWQRVWLMRKSETGFVCESCAGGLTNVEWDGGVKYASENLNSLLDEIAHDIVQRPRQNDNMHRVCVSEGVTQAAEGLFRMSADLFHRQRVPHPAEVLFEVPTEMEEAERKHWMNIVKEAAAKQGLTYDHDERVFACPFQLDGDEYFAVFGWRAVRADVLQPRPIESGAILSMCRAMTSSKRTNDSHSRDPSVFLRRVLAVLVTLDSTPLAHEEFEGAKLRRLRMEFQESPEFRDKLREEMLSARDRRVRQAKP